MNHPLFNPDTVGKLDKPSFKTELARNPQTVGRSLQLETQGPDPLRIFGLPTNLNFEFRVLTKPYTIVRQITQDTLAFLAAAKKTSSIQNRVVFTGRAGCGKSFVMLQAVESCVQEGWVVIYIPRGINLVNSTTSYTYNIRTQTYLQPAFSFQTLQRMLSVNRDALAAIPLSEDLVLERQTVRAGTPLSTVIEVGIAERDRTVAQSPAILEGVMKSLEVQTKYPVLLAVDDFQALYGKTAYRDPHFQHIQPYHLSLPRMIMEYASGKRNFARGAVLGALSLAHTNYPLPLELRDALELQDLDAHPASPYLKRSKDLLAYTEGLKKLEVPEKLTVKEATGIFEVWKARNAIGHGYHYHFRLHKPSHITIGWKANILLHILLLLPPACTTRWTMGISAPGTLYSTMSLVKNRISPLWKAGSMMEPL
ncbi:hypothetical protein CVT25_002186 [Psilocybe cyanescens]|uniref:Small ribosomal subunit protein mS29 n=1 Tax=Psilocybe cyanescens TaxID=93625 RepID=A0A409XF76_PSICY|nr:hypothetical protein CVT25_002186 [Psilocybe cyanescens]